MIKRFLCFVCILFISSAYSQVIPSGDFAKDYEYLSVKLSPDGSKLGVVMKIDGKRRLATLNVSNFETLGGIDFGDRGEVGNFHWVNNERLVIELWQRKSWLEQGENLGELFAINYDGSNSDLIYGYRAGEERRSSRIKKKEATRGWAEIVNVLPNDEKHILISSTSMTDRFGYQPNVASIEDFGNYPTVHKLNVYTGKLYRASARAPVPFTQFITTKDGELAFAIGTDEKSYNRSYRYIDREWVEMTDEIGSAFLPLVLDDSGDQLLFIDNLNQDKAGLYSLDLKSGKRSTIYVDENVDIEQVNFNADRSSAYAVRIDDGFPTYVMFNDSGKEAALFKAFLATFPGYKINVVSRSEDLSKSILHISNDVDPGSYYLFDSAENKLQFLFANLSNLDAKKMAQSTPISFSSFDGTKVHGYITYPINMDNKQKVPLVTLVHGGPHGIRDYWAFDREVQMLAAQGYAVLRVNYRGSGGYGAKFLASGYKQWGGAIQKDIIAGTQWALEQGKIDAAKVCIMGASFGGYSAVMAATLAPDLFKCAVANAGAYDLQMMLEQGDIPDLLYGSALLEHYIGSNEAKLVEFSPVHNVEKLKAKVFIAHGERDKRVPFAQAQGLKKALDKHNKPYVWFTKRTESHGFFDQGNRKDYYEQVSKFLATHLQ